MKFRVIRKKPSAPISQASLKHIITKESQLSELVETLKHSEAFTFDIETADSLDVVCKPEIVGVGFYSDTLAAPKFIPVGFNNFTNQLPIQRTIKAIQPLFNDNADRLAIAHNAKFDTAGLEFYGLKITRWNSRIRCSQILSHLMDENKPSGLKERVRIEFGHKMQTLGELQGKRNTKAFKRMVDLPVDGVAQYCGADVLWTWNLWHKLYPQLVKEKFLEAYYLKIENPTVRSLKRIHKRGVDIDWAFLKELDGELAGLVAKAEARVQKIAGYAVNLNSPAQKAKLLFKELRLDKHLGVGMLKKSKKTGALSTDKETLKNLTGLHPIIEPIQDYMGYSKLKATYTTGMPKKKLADGRIHTHFNQAAVDTGRLSSTEPNLQNIPSHSKLGKRIRLAFIPPDGKKFLVADYDNIELKILAHQSQDAIMLDKFKKGEDLHSLTASIIYKLPLDQCGKDTPEGNARRDNAKKLNFGIMYGMQKWALAKNLGIDIEEAEEFRHMYFGLYPGVKDYIYKTERQAKTLGFVRTMFGRKRRLPNAMLDDDDDWEMRRDKARALRQAVNFRIQGTQAEIIKMAMNKIEAEVPRAAIHLQVHDELVCSVDEDCAEEVLEEVKDCMMYPTQDRRNLLAIPMTVSIKVVNSWGEAK